MQRNKRTMYYNQNAGEKIFHEQAEWYYHSGRVTTYSRVTVTLTGQQYLNARKHDSLSGEGTAAWRAKIQTEAIFPLAVRFPWQSYANTR